MIYGVSVNIKQYLRVRQLSKIKAYYIYVDYYISNNEL